MQRLLIAVALFLLAPLALAQAYKWTDAHGTIHFSETPPPTGTNYKKIRTNGSADPLVAPAPAASSGGSLEATPSAPAQPVADTPENREKLCSTLKANLAALQGQGPVVMQQGGKNVALDTSQRTQQISAAQAQFQQYCGR